MCRSMILVGAVLVIAILFPLRLWGEGDGVIEGRVVNATAGDAPLQSAQVTLRTWSGEAELDPRTATTDETGHYRFDNLDIEGRLKTPHLMYFLKRIKNKFRSFRLPKQNFKKKVIDSKNADFLK